MKKEERKEIDLMVKDGKREVLVEKTSRQLQHDHIIAYKNMLHVLRIRICCINRQKSENCSILS